MKVTFMVGNLMPPTAGFVESVRSVIAILMERLCVDARFCDSVEAEPQCCCVR